MHNIPSVCTARTRICAHVKDPVSICRKSVQASQQVVWKHEDTVHMRKKEEEKTWVAPCYDWSLPPWESSPHFQCIALEQ